MKETRIIRKTPGRSFKNMSDMLLLCLNLSKGSHLTQSKIQNYSGLHSQCDLAPYIFVALFFISPSPTQFPPLPPPPARPSFRHNVPLMLQAHTCPRAFLLALPFVWEEQKNFSCSSSLKQYPPLPLLTLPPYPIHFVCHAS